MGGQEEHPPPSSRSSAAVVIACGVLALVTVLHLAGHLLGALRWVSGTHMLLMPLLGLALFLATRAPRPRQTRLTLVALGFSWLGDTAPSFTSGRTAFLLLVGLFLVAQVFYSVAFLPDRRYSILRRPLWLLPYLALSTGLVVLCAPRGGGLLPLIILYAAAILTMAVCPNTASG